MMKNPSFSSTAASAALSILYFAAEISAQARPRQAAPPPEPSIFESVWLYVGVLVIAGLVGLMIFIRKKEKEAAARPLIPVGDTELKITFK